MYEMYNIDNKVNVYLNDEDLKPYNITAEELYSHKPFDARLIDDIMKEASKRFGKEYKFRDFMHLDIIPYGVCAIISFE